MHSPRLLVALLLCAAAALCGADAVVGTASDAARAANWRICKPFAAAGQVEVTAEGMTLQVEPDGWMHADLALGGRDGDDAAPLRVSAAIAAEDAALAGGPTMVAFAWGPGCMVGVGIGDGGDRRADGNAHRRRAWVWTMKDGKAGLAPTAVWMYPGAAAAHVRLVLTSHDLSAYASMDGWSWQRVGAWARDADLSAAPARLSIGRGCERTAEPAPVAAAPHAPAKALAAVRISALSVTNAAPTLPPALLKDYEKKATLEDSRDAEANAGRVRSWQVLGPFIPGPQAPGPEAARDLSATYDLMGSRGGWKPFTPGDAPIDRVIKLSDRLAGPGIAWLASTTITAAAPGQARFLFDGGGDLTLFINGVAFAQTQHDGGDVRPDRCSVVAPLIQGGNVVVVRVVSDDKGRAAFTLRHEPGDPLYRISLLKRWGIDFSGEISDVVNGQFEISRLWQDLGCTQQAAESLDAIIRNPAADAETVDAALIARTARHRDLRAEDKVAADIEELQKRWLASETADPAAAQLKVAQLWERLDDPAKADAALTRALAVAGPSADELIEVGLSCARMHARLHQQQAVGEDLRSVAARLDPADPRRGEFLVRAVRDEPGTAADLEHAVQGLALARLSGSALRQLGGESARRADQPLHHAVLQALAASDSQEELDAPAVALAEALIAEHGDASQAAALYGSSISALAGMPAAEMPARGPGDLRLAYVAACLDDSPAGREVMHDARASDATHQGHRRLPAEPRDFKVCGSFPDPGFRCYEPSFLDPVHPERRMDTSKPIEGKPWVVPAPSCWDKGYLDLLDQFHATDCCAFAYTEVSSDMEIDSELRMGADDGLVLWFNGVKVHEDRTQRGIAPDSIQVPVHFKKGANTILAMIQQGSGDWAFQFRIVDGNLYADLATAFTLLSHQPDDRPGALRLMVSAMDGLARMERSDRAEALARMILRAFPDFPEDQYSAALRLADLCRSRGDAATARALAAWLEGSAAAASAAHLSQTCDTLAGLGQLMTDAGLFQQAQSTYESLLLSGLDSPHQIQALYGLGELYRHGGYKRQANHCYRVAIALDSDANGQLHQGVMSTRANRADLSPPDTSTEAESALAVADNAAAGGNVELAVSSYQQAAEAFADGQLWQDAPGHFTGIPSYCVSRVRALGAPGLQSYHDQFGAEAEAALARAPADDAAALERVARTYPLAAAGTRALERAADLYRAAGDPGLCAATLRRLAEGGMLAPTSRPQVLAEAVAAAALAGDADGVAELSAALSAAGGSVHVDGRSLDAASYLAQLRVAAPSSDASSQDPAIRAAATLCRFPVSAIDIHSAREFSRGYELQAACRPLCDHGVAFISDLECNLAISLRDGACRWQAASDVPDLEAPLRGAAYAGIPEYQCARCAGRVIARAMRHGQVVIDARDVRSGALAWSTEAIGSLRGLAASSSPTASGQRVYALFTDQVRIYAAAFNGVDGRLLWRTPVSSRRGTIPVQGDFGVFTDGNAAAPTCCGRDLLVANDLGGVVCIDAGSGEVRWMASYLRAVLGTGDVAALTRLLNRAPTRIWADQERICLVPHDSLSVLAFSRAHGDPLWRREFSQARQIAGAAGPGRLLLQGDGLELIDVRTGFALWRWRAGPAEGPTLGTAAIGAANVYVATSNGIHRIALDSGATQEFHAWHDLGIGAPLPVNLLLSDGELIGVGNGALVRFSSSPPPPFPPLVIRGDDARDAALAAATAATGAQSVAVGASSPAATGSPLGVAWSLRGDAVLGITHPASWPAGHCLVRFAHSLARIDVPALRLLWRTTILPGLDGVGANGETALEVQSQRLLGRLTAIDLASGDERWSAEYGNFFLDALDENAEGRQYVWFLCDGAALSCRINGGTCVVDLANGSIIGRYELNGNVLNATAHGGHLFAVIRRGETTCIEERDLVHGTLIAAYAPGAEAGDDRGIIVDDGLVISHQDHAELLHLDTRTLTHVPFAMPLGGVQAEGGDLLAYGGYSGKPWHQAVIDAASGTVRFQEEMSAPQDGAHVGIYASHLYGDRLVRLDPERAGKNGILCRQLSNGAELWRIAGGDPAQVAYHGQAAYGGHAVVFRTRAEGVFDYQLIDVATGTVAATGPLPGWPAATMPTATIGDTVVYGTAQGLFALRPIVAALGHGDPEDAITALTPPSPLLAPRTQLPLATETDPDAWIGIPASTLGAENRRVIGHGIGTVASTAPATLTATLRSAYDSDAMHLLVLVNSDPRHHQDPPPGAAMLAGDCVIIGLDPGDPTPSGRAAPVTLALALDDGRPRMSVLAGHFAAGVDGQLAATPSVRIAEVSEGIAYALTIPWPLLRATPDQRPGSNRAMRLGVAVLVHHGTAATTILELGHGLVRGLEPRLWPPMSLVDGPR